MTRCVIVDGWKYLAARKRFTPSERPNEVRQLEEVQLGLQAGTVPMTDVWGPPVFEELYSLSDDPRETKNVLEEQAAMREKLRAILEKHEKTCRERGIATPPRQEVPALSQEELDLLHCMGYF